MSVREATNRALRLCEEGLISYKTLATMALKFMSDDEVSEMLRANELLYDEETEENEED